MRKPVLFTVVTDDIDFALSQVFACARSNAPSFARVIDDPVEILALPHGAKVHIAIWTTRRDTSGAEIAWRERRMRGGLVFLTDEEMEKVSRWRARHVAGERAAPATPTAPVETAALPSMAGIAPSTPPQLAQEWR
ncbi:hypothetical protein [Mycoplana rhizolycopersici]|uniref:Uncharacterized protein n=1 Tax=Mycoplana rhizolycopersici TaxID=2746702 RepID=A0ABX2QA27_9HYPH|nr:hypothetical protein [Rhizobium rhizolycopersici]NVP54480.1 hypothetical protein [Rhizobium rhizolycopersici]